MPFLTVDEIDLYYEIKGEGEPILFIHCPVFPSEVMRPQSQNLSKSYQVINLDLRGHGRSSPSKKKWDFSTIVEDIKALIDHINVGPVWVYAYSAGCSIAFELAISAPSYVKGLIQVGAVDEVDSPILTTITKGGEAISKRGVTNLIAFFGTFSNTKKINVLFPLMRSAFKANALDAESFYQSYLNYKCTERLNEIKHPTLLVYGEYDKLLGRYGYNIATEIPDSQIKIIKGGRHQIPSNKSKELNTVIHDFLAKRAL
ncbi:alpha/beta fold hydrolase [Alkalibacillus haloalkaliphilus]|uniref:alpha/beta fold hydrolase n=1 Tax=Alkalibacillus haloalkaliphilus TaxID=94136 RepID=UPI0003181FEF|nr:alpha/beta hydrolase [Alkalibacillus haloalkaliphilus]